MDTWFIAEGRLHRLDGSGAQHVVESPFVAEAVARSERSRQIAGWKHAARDDDDRGRLVPRSALWGTSGGAGFSAEHRFRHVVRGANDSVYYVVTLGRGTALFRYYPAEIREVRLFHGASMQCLGIAAEPGTERIALSAGNADGTASLEIVDGDGRRRGNVTGGDSIDGAPSFSESAPGTVVFQSSGVARNAQTNQAAAIGPAAILRLNLSSSQLDTLVENADFDHLAPKEDRGGNLWFIRRPYEKSSGEVALDAGKSALMFPWRVVKGVVGFLDTFSKVYGQEPLKRSGPQLPTEEPNLGAIWLHGRMVALSEVRYDTGRGGGLVPRSWELVCRNRHGKEFVSARHVASFDVGGDAIVYSNGFELFRLVDGEWQSIAQSKLVEAVCAGSA